MEARSTHVFNWRVITPCVCIAAACAESAPVLGFCPAAPSAHTHLAERRSLDVCCPHTGSHLPKIKVAGARVVGHGCSAKAGRCAVHYKHIVRWSLAVGPPHFDVPASGMPHTNPPWPSPTRRAADSTLARRPVRRGSTCPLVSLHAIGMQAGCREVGAAGCSIRMRMVPCHAKQSHPGAAAHLRQQLLAVWAEAHAHILLHQGAQCAVSCCMWVATTRTVPWRFPVLQQMQPFHGSSAALGGPSPAARPRTPAAPCAA